MHASRHVVTLADCRPTKANSHDKFEPGFSQRALELIRFREDYVLGRKEATAEQVREAMRELDEYLPDLLPEEVGDS